VWPFSRRAEKRTSGDWFVSFADLIKVANTAAGVSVTPSNSIEHPAVYRCLYLNQSTIGSFPVDCLVKRGGKRLPYHEPLWMKAPNDYQDFHDLVGDTIVSCDQYDAAFLLKASMPSGQLVGLSVLDPNAVQMKRVDLGDGVPRIVYDVTTARGVARLAQTEILFIKAGLPVPGKLRGIAPTTALKETIGLGVAARQYGANFYGSGATLSGVIESAKDMNNEQIERLEKAFTRKHGGVSKSHAIGILSGGAQWKQIETDPDKAQALDTMKYTDGVIAAIFGIPAEYVTPVGMEGAKGYVTGLYQRQMLWYQTGLFPRITKLERAFSSLLPGSAYIKFNVNAWLRMDPEQRTAFYQAMQGGENMAPNEIRALEDMDPLGPEYDLPLKSVQWQHDGDPPSGGDTGTNSKPAPAGSSVKEGK
jgi:HK97 family phage portal protein